MKELHMKDYINDQDFIKWQKKHARKLAVAEGLKIFAILGLIMLLLALCTTAISMALNTPEVEYSWETKECRSRKGQRNQADERYRRLLAW